MTGLVHGVQVMCMLVNAHELEAVSLPLPLMLALPRLQHLRHLVLEQHPLLGPQPIIETQLLSDLDAASAPNLETLHLSLRVVWPPEPVHPQKYYLWMHDSGRGCLRLNRLQRLRHVTLLRFAPVKVVLPEECGLTLIGSLEMAARVWKNRWHESAIGQHLRMLYIISGEEYCQQNARYEGARDHPQNMDVLWGTSDKLRHVFSAFCPRLTHLSLACATFGAPEAPLVLGEGMPALQCLQLTHCHGIFASFSKSVQPRVLHISCVARPGSVMSLQFADVTAFAAKLTALKVDYCTFSAHGVGLASLRDALFERGLLAARTDYYGRVTRVFWPHENSAGLAMRNALWTGAPPDPDTGWSPNACQCQACEWCLRRAGALSAL